jgi:hypothetical protein
MLFRPCLLAAALLATVAFVQPAVSADWFPPDFRGLPGSVYALWDLNNPENPDLADAFNAVPLDGLPLYEIPPIVEILNLEFATVGDTSGWLATGDFGILNFCVPNFIDFLPVKDIWVQINYIAPNPNPADPLTFPWVAAVEASDNEVGFVLGEFTGSFNIPQIGYRLETWVVRPNPDFELIQIFVPRGVLVDQVIIDTISTVPEVSTMVLCGVSGFVIAGFGYVRRRRSA